MTPNPDCPDCHGAGEIPLFNGVVPCACTERDEGLDARLEAARKALAMEPEKALPEAYKPLITGVWLEAIRKALAADAIVPVLQTLEAYTPPKEMESITVNGVRLRSGETLWLTLGRAKHTVQFIPPDRLLVDLRD